MIRRLALVSAAVLAPLAASAQMLTLGAGQGGFSAPYVPGAAHFNQLYSISTSSPLSGVVDGSKGRIFFRFRGVPSNSTLSNTAITILNGDLFGNKTTGCSNFENCQGWNSAFDNAGAYGSLRFNLNDSTGGTGHQCLMAVTGLIGGSGGIWHDIIEEWDTSPVGVSKLATVYYDGVKQGAGGCTGPALAMLVNYSSANGFSIALPITSPPDPRMAIELSQVFIDFTTSNIDNSNNLSAGEVSSLRGAGGAPVDLAIPCASATLCVNWTLGSATPTISGTASSGVAATGTAYTASIAPGQTRTGPYERWSIVPYVTPVTGLTSLTTNAGGATFNLGDLILTSLTILDNSNTTGNHNPTCPTGFAQQYRDWDNGAANNPSDFVVCTKTADAGDVAGTGSYQFNWTTAPTRGLSYTLSTYAQATVDVVDGQRFGSAATSTSMVCKSVTATGASDTLVNIGITYATNPTIAHVTAAQEELSLGSNVGPDAFVADEYLSASGATGTRTHNIGTSTSGQCATIALK